MTDLNLKPPFQIYNGLHIMNEDGHVLTAENAEIAQTVLNLLNGSHKIHAPKKPELTAERVLNWIELALLRERDRATRHNVSSDIAKMLTDICDHLIEFRREFNEQG